jgi:hypothetical protein
MTLLKRLMRIEKQLQKVRGCSPLTDGWQTQKYARKARKWDELAKEKFEILKKLEELGQDIE